jgi:excisionase family DNA binding protein
MPYDAKDEVHRRYYTIAETGRIFGVCRSTIESWHRSGILRTVKLGGRRLVPESAIRDLEAGTS